MILDGVEVCGACGTSNGPLTDDACEHCTARYEGFLEGSRGMAVAMIVRAVRRGLTYDLTTTAVYEAVRFALAEGPDVEDGSTELTIAES